MWAGSLDYRRASHRATISPVARGCSAVGSASPCQGEGRGFESRHPLEGANWHQSPAVEWPSGEATACKAVHTGSIPVSTSKSFQPGAISSAGERFPDTEEVTGSIPVSRTRVCAVQRNIWNDAMAHRPRRGRRGTRRIASSSAPAPPQPSVTWSSFVSAVGHLSHP